MKQPKNHILMTGGGTLGPVTPLIAIAREWQRRDPNATVSWIGTPSGPERMIVEEAGYSFSSLYAPKLARDKKWSWPFIPALMAYSCVAAFLMLKKSKPKMIFTAGGYVSVPIVLAGRVLGIPSWVHQLDVKPGLANRAMAPFAKKVSVTWLESLESFAESKTIQAGSVVRDGILKGSKDKVVQKHKLDPEKKTVFVMGGGTGASSINEAMSVIGADLSKSANVIHLTGLGKKDPRLDEIADNYISLEFLGKNIADYFAAADVFVGRAGMGTILEIAALGKASVLIPIGNTDQLANARAVDDANAAIIIHQLNGQILKQEILRLLEDDEQRWELQDKIRELFIENGEERIVKEAMELFKA